MTFYHPQLRKPLIYSILALSASTLTTGCADNELMGPDPVEDFTHSFVEAFGPFRAESWSEAVSTGIA